MAKGINYALDIPDEVASRATHASIEGLIKSYGDLVAYYLERELALRKRVYRGTVEPEPGAGAGTGASGKKQSAQGASPFVASDKNIRGGAASSLKAINTRRGKFGSTKLKQTTKEKLESKGFQIGKPTIVPGRTGVNKPKGRA